MPTQTTKKGGDDIAGNCQEAAALRSRCPRVGNAVASDASASPHGVEMSKISLDRMLLAAAVFYKMSRVIAAIIHFLATFSAFHLQMSEFFCIFVGGFSFRRIDHHMKGVI